jgi:hypothetical protein
MFLMTIVAIHQPQYFPYLGFFHKLLCCDVFVVMDDVQFHRRAFQHRNYIKTKQGAQMLTVPLRHTKHRDDEIIREMVIDDSTDWSRKHWGSIAANYAKAPYFTDYAKELQSILHHDWHNLCNLDMTIVQWLMDILEIRVPIVYQSQLNVGGSKSELLINLCQAVGAKQYLSGQGAKTYMDLSAFSQAGIEVVWQQFVMPTYAQMFPETDFLESMSMIDTLLCWGQEAKQYLRSQQAHRLPQPVCSQTLPLTNLPRIDYV